ncbi:MAG: hypothetical protein ACTSRG_09075 [Candidatus Helarchaeota archaeon]
MLEQLFEKPSVKKLKIVSLISGIFFFLITAIFSYFEIETKTVTGYGLLDYELALTKGKAITILLAWGVRYIPIEISLNQLDFVYMFTYSTFFVCISLLLKRKLEDGRFGQLGLYFSLSPVIVAISDVFETTNLLIMLNSPFNFNDFTPTIASVFAIIKITFIVIAFSYLFLGFLKFVIEKR